VPLPDRLRSRTLRLAATLATLAALAACGDANEPDDEGDPPVAGCRDGEIGGHGLHRLCFPENWNGDLIVYAHGYVAPGEPLAIQDDPIGGVRLSSIATGLGYAFATTSYRSNGLVVVEAIEDIAELEEEVRRLVRPDPGRTYLVGASEGGLVAALAAERRPELLDGALSLCGPVGDFRRQMEHFGDFRVVFDYFYPGVLPGDLENVPDELQDAWDETYVPAVTAALQADPARADQLFAVTGAAEDPADPSTRIATAVGLLWYSVFANPEAQDRLGGLPYGNADRTYAGSADDAALNAGIQRFEADPDALAEIAASYQTTGELARPLELIHTTGDPTVPVEQQRLYLDEIRAAGAEALAGSREAERYGHCAFTGAEVLGAFDDLVARVDGGASASASLAGR
jgi:pimeloyl-ACP methyl ester carboxylesterase